MLFHIIAFALFLPVVFIIYWFGFKNNLRLQSRVIASYGFSSWRDWCFPFLKLYPTHSFIAFSAFVSFFPQPVAGSIERAINLIAQFIKKRPFNYNTAADGRCI